MRPDAIASGNVSAVLGSIAASGASMRPDAIASGNVGTRTRPNRDYTSFNEARRYRVGKLWDGLRRNAETRCFNEARRYRVGKPIHDGSWCDFQAASMR